MHCFFEIFFPLPSVYTERSFTSTLIFIYLFQTNRPRHYAFIKFKNEAVARIAAESMDNYLMFGKRMRCAFIPGNQIPRAMFPRKVERRTTHEIHKETTNMDKSPTAVFKLAMKKKRRVLKIVKELKDMGIDYSCVVINEPKKGE